MTTYLATSALARLDEAQQQIDQHVVRGRDGRCPRCGESEPCGRRNAASTVFARYGACRAGGRDWPEAVPDERPASDAPSTVDVCDRRRPMAVRDGAADAGWCVWRR